MKQFFSIVVFSFALIASAHAFAASASAADFSRWAVLVVAGDNHAHNGNPSAVFDNARRDLVKAFTGMGFSPANIAQFAVSPDPAAQHANVRAIANTLWDLSSRAPDGCLIYFTSHGSPDGVVVGDDIFSPKDFARMVNNACASRPTVVVVSACFSGVFVPYLRGANRFVLTAARPDRTSFGCGQANRYTFFDECFLSSIGATHDFPDLAVETRRCVASREVKENMSPPSEPQVAIGTGVAAFPRW